MSTLSPLKQKTHSVPSRPIDAPIISTRLIKAIIYCIFVSGIEMLILISKKLLSGASSLLGKKFPVSFSERQNNLEPLAAVMMSDSQLTIETTRKCNYTSGAWCIL